ncbi:alpha/beta fold hydrolase [Paludibaculum fermentans]|uniref:Alpha/beta hydrolase n=1 Tax=Paludibaculum fermentans TaxID=1473598 RepID=A0A7S7NS90_PALFE|nr:alpha/beta hydrolase [Paludibaculum fermentans]QOY88766.1 alpha/beta hydrolase [Paludibaculum fermentans]
MPITHGFAQANGIRMHYAEAGTGPLVLLLHGFPELWHAWRHQLAPLAAAGCRAVAPDLRGYGQTECPEPLEAYDIFQLAGDLVGLVHALCESRAIVVGHDWGAWIAAHLALLRPDIFRGLVLLSVPYVPRRTVNQTQWEQQTFPGQVFYQAGLRSPMADQYLKHDVRASLLRGLYSLSAEAGPEERFRPARAPGPPSGAPPARGPSWIAEGDIDYLAGEFQRTGFTGGLNCYRNMDRNWALTPFLDGARIHQPSLFVAGEQDPVLEFLQPEFAALQQNMPNLTKKVLLPATGHWTQQERPGEVNRLLLEFLAGL